MQLTTQLMIPNGGSRQAQLPLSISARSVLCAVSFPAAILGQDNETIINRYKDGTRADHIRFVFDMSAGAGLVEEPRFWITEILDLEAVKKLTIRQAIAEILGAREDWPRAEIGIQWNLSSNLLTDLIRSGQLRSPNGRRLLRADLEQFLISRWTGNRA